jgi:cobalt-zinc-cadmium efflux system outer membrane protein
MAEHVRTMRYTLSTACFALLWPLFSAAQAPQPPGHAGHAPAQAQPAAAEKPFGVPRLGRALEQAQGPRMRLEDLEKMALQHNPTLRQAAAEIAAAQGRRTQAGLLPNPVVGYTGEEIRGGFARGGQHGFFVEQSIVLGGKLRLGQQVFQQEVRLAEIEAEEQRLRVTNAVRLGFYQVLASQETLATLRDLLQLAGENMATSRRLLNIGQADETEVLQAEVEMQHAELAILREEARLRRLWTALAAVVGRPELPLATLDARLDENLPVLDEAQVVRKLLHESPAARLAEANVGRADAGVAFTRRQSVPDLRLRGGLQQNRERIDTTGRPAGLQGFAEIGIQLPLFNRNQGNLQAARAERDRAEQERIRVALVLRERAAVLLEDYRDARARAERYRTQILPRSGRAYQLMWQRWGQMGVSYPQLLAAQRTWFQAQTDYIAALGELWSNSIAVEGFLLTDGLEAPARPGEVDLPVREINIPTPRGSAGRED